MPTPSRSVSWFKRLRMRVDRQQTDWADLGTAQGLDLSVQQLRAAADGALNAQPTQQARSLSWWGRARKGGPLR